MAPRNRNRNNNRAPSKAQAAPQVQQAPMDPMFVQNKFDRGATYIPGLYQPGMRGYDAKYGGGGWANFGTTPTTDQVEGLKSKLASDFASGRMVTSPTNPEPGQSPETQATSQKSYKDIKSIGGGLKIGGDNILGRREAMKIARGTGKGYDDVITKALGRGMSIGGGAVRQSNMAAGTSQINPTIKGQQMFTSGGSDDALSQMRRVNPGRRQMYSGTYELDGKTTPLVESRRGGVNPMSIGGGKGKRGNKGRNKGGGMTDSEITSPTNDVTPQAMDYTPMTPEQMKDASTVEGFGALSGGGAGVGGATKLGRAKSRLRQLGIYGRGTGLLSRGLQYGNVLNA